MELGDIFVSSLLDDIPNYQVGCVTLIIFYKQRSDLATSLRFLALLICVA